MFSSVRYIWVVVVKHLFSLQRHFPLFGQYIEISCTRSRAYFFSLSSGLDGTRIEALAFLGLTNCKSRDAHT